MLPTKWVAKKFVPTATGMGNLWVCASCFEGGRCTQVLSINDEPKPTCICKPKEAV
jgi:hypothetical protein